MSVTRNRTTNHDLQPSETDMASAKSGKMREVMREVGISCLTCGTVSGGLGEIDSAALVLGEFLLRALVQIPSVLILCSLTIYGELLWWIGLLQLSINFLLPQIFSHE
jgi:hypothetical protein